MKRTHLMCVTRFAIVAGLTVSAALFVAGSASATVPTTARASLSKGLANGQTITVVGSGFTPGATVAIVECNSSVLTTGEPACDTSNVAFRSVTSTGTVRRTSFTVATGTIGNGSCVAAVGVPTADNTCYLAVANIADMSQEALVKIFFGLYGVARPAVGLTNGQAITVSGGGFTAGATVAVVECNNSILTTGEAACDTSNVAFATAAANGHIPGTSFTVATGTIGNGTCSSTTPNRCYLAVANISNTAQEALVRIHF